ncbi:hypothetical protein ACFL14_01970 [Patescibacteria group bacterium]
MKKLKTKKSFTLTEILLVAAIISLLTAVTIAGLRVQRVDQNLFQQAQKVTNLLELARTYAANPRTQDWRPEYYLVHFVEFGKSGSEQINIDELSIDRAELIVYFDIDNDGDIYDGIDDDGTDDEIIETVNLQDHNINLWFSNLFYLDHDDIPDAPDNFLGCTGGSFALGFRVGNPNQILTRCDNEDVTDRPWVPIPSISRGILPTRFNEDQGDIPDTPPDQWVFIRIINSGQRIEVCKGTPNNILNDDECN